MKNINSLENNFADSSQRLKITGLSQQLFVKPRLGRMIFDHKTGAEIQIMSPKSFSETKMYYEPVGARSCVKNFSRSVAA